MFRKGRLSIGSQPVGFDTGDPPRFTCDVRAVGKVRQIDRTKWSRRGFAHSFRFAPSLQQTLRWLLHRELDAAVAAAYGWLTDLDDDETLRRLFELNQERAGAGR